MSSEKIALITGVTGQDGFLLAKHLLHMGYTVHGLKRHHASESHNWLQQLVTQNPDRLFLHNGDLSDTSSVIRIMSQTRPDELYNLAAMSHVKVSFDLPLHTADVDGLGVARILEGLRVLGLQKKTKFYQAGTSELFGNSIPPQNEETPFMPRSPYAAAKLYAYWMVRIYREAHQIFASNGILFNHESCWRGSEFVTKKITKSVARIALGMQSDCQLGNLNSLRDWGHAEDYIKAIHLILQQNEPDDFVIATGKTHSVREFVEMAFECIGIRIHFNGEGLDEVGLADSIDTARFEEMTKRPCPLANGQILVRVDPRQFRLLEVNSLRGDASKAHQLFQWQPEKTIHQLVEEMVCHDLMTALNEKALPSDKLALAQ